MSIYKELGIRKHLGDFTWVPEFTDNKGLVGVYSVRLDDSKLDGCGFSHIVLGNNELTKFTFSRKRELIGRLNPYNYFILDGKLFIYLPGDPTDENISKLPIRFSNLNEITIEFDELGSESINTLVATFETNNSTSLVDSQGDLVTEYKSNAPYNRQWTISEMDGAVTFKSNGIGKLYSMDGVASCGGSVGSSSNTNNRLNVLEELTKPATTDTFGTIKVGNYLDIDTDGKLNVVIPGDIIFIGDCIIGSPDGSHTHILDDNGNNIINFKRGYKYLINRGEYNDGTGNIYTTGDYIIVKIDATDSTEHLTVADVVFINSQESDVAKLPLNNVFTGTSNTFDGNLLVNGSTTLNGPTDVMDIEYVGESGGSTEVTENSNKLVTSGAVHTAVYNERVRAEARETALDTAISNEVARATGVENQLRTDLTQESTDRAEQVSNLQSNKVNKTTTIADIDLQDSITKSELLTALNVEDGAQVNIIESIKVNGTEQNITDKSVDITVPTGALASKDTVAEDDLSDELKAKVNGISDIEGNVLTIQHLLDRLNSFPEGNKLTWLVDSDLDTGSSVMSYDVNSVDQNGLMAAFVKFIDCIKHDKDNEDDIDHVKGDTGELIDNLRSFVGTIDINYILNGPFIDIDDEKSFIPVFIKFINIFRYSMDYGPITTIIKSSNGLAKLPYGTIDKTKVANALLFIISRFSDNDVEIVSYTTEIDGSLNITE